MCFSDSDPIFTPKAGQRFVDLIPGAGELRVIEGAAHFLQEDKGEQIARRDQRVPRGRRRWRSRSVEYLLIGGGLASGNCARHLREQGAEGEILIVGREPDPPYNRPPLSKEYMRGEESRDGHPVPARRAGTRSSDVEVLTRTSVM